jgi:FkbH-like protein
MESTERLENGAMSLSEILRDLRPTPSAYLDAARRIEREAFEELRPVTVAILSTFTAELLRPYLVVESAARGMLVRPYYAPFNQLEQQVLDDSSDFYESKPNVAIIAARIEEITPDLVYRYTSLSPAGIAERLGNIEARLQDLIDGLRQRSNATVLVFNFSGFGFQAAGLADASLERSQASVIQRANERVADVCRKFTDVHVFDYARVMSESGLRQSYDPKLWYLGRIPFGAQAQLELGRRLARYLHAIYFPPSKCLVVDLDNTLWGGVIGEDGIGGIALGEDYPGNVYKEFQRRLLSLRDQGFLLAVASKNNASDVMEVFQKHPDCVLKAEHFATLQVNWQDKATSLSKIARELSIGTDALAFFDDNPAEREWVRLNLPEVTVIEVPDSPLGFAQALDESGAFDRLSMSTEDQQRAEMYQKEQERGQLQARSVSVDEFLRQLDMTATIGHVGPETLPRVAQIIGKTNQFNLTTRRYTASELQAMMDSGAIALWLRLADRYGDSGLVGVAITAPGDSSQWSVDTFLMSCRVIGRQVETVLLSVLSRMVRSRGAQVLMGEYIPTPKNGLASGFYSDHGFESVDSEGRIWKWDLSKGEVPLPKLVKTRFADGASY